MTSVTSDSLGFAIVGCGLIGKKRSAQLPKGSVKATYDLKKELADSLAKSLPGCVAYETYEEILACPDVNAVIIATFNSALAPLAQRALLAGKHVLLEKPGAISVKEIQALREIEKSGSLKVRVGFNHRYHPALQKAHELFKSGALGPLMFIRGRYGHGGRVGYEKEWRANAEISGGGELMDQGVHLINLAEWFLGDFAQIEGHASTLFWNMPVDDNAFMSLRTEEGQTAWLHVSCTEWKNLFSLEIYGRDAKLHIEGLGGSYGVERLHCYQMLPQMGPPDTTVFEYPRGDESWKLEMDEFRRDILEDRRPNPGLREAEAALRVVEEIYLKSGYLPSIQVARSDAITEVNA